MWDTRVRSLGWEDTPGKRNGNPLWYTCLENPMDGEACSLQSVVGYSLWGFKESDRTERLHFHFHFPSVSDRYGVWNVILHLIPSCWDFSFTLGGGVSFLVESNILLLMVVEQRVVILEVSQGKMSVHPSTLPSCVRKENLIGKLGKN